jgi:hypothetical protein
VGRSTRSIKPTCKAESIATPPILSLAKMQGKQEHDEGFIYGLFDINEIEDVA